jgi:hypothetical protein
MEDYPETYELIFQASAVDDVVVVRRTDRSGAGGSPVYEDETGIVRAEISDRGEVRMLATGGHQAHELPVTARRASAVVGDGIDRGGASDGGAGEGRPDDGRMSGTPHAGRRPTHAGR